MNKKEEINKYRKILEELEADKTEYDNNNIELIDQYIKANNDPDKQKVILHEYDNNILEVKKLNRRIVLLKNQCGYTL